LDEIADIQSLIDVQTASALKWGCFARIGPS
jgi:hypothetical protein